MSLAAAELRLKDSTTEHAAAKVELAAAEAAYAAATSPAAYTRITNARVRVDQATILYEAAVAHRRTTFTEHHRAALAAALKIADVRETQERLAPLLGRFAMITTEAINIVRLAVDELTAQARAIDAANAAALALGERLPEFARIRPSSLDAIFARTANDAIDRAGVEGRGHDSKNLGSLYRFFERPQR